MSIFRPLQQRVLEPEDIDDPELATEQLHGALHGLTTINWLSASAAILWPEIRQLALEAGDRPVRILDIATGAGDVPMALWRKAQRARLRVEIHGTDISERAIAFAEARAKNAQAPVTFGRLDVFHDPLPASYDVVMCSLFLHHLTDEQAKDLLGRMAAAAKVFVLVNDLRRSSYGLALAHFAGRALTRSPIVRVDAVRSVRAAFTISEARQLAVAAGLAGATVRRRWPCRFLLSWSKTVRPAA